MQKSSRRFSLLSLDWLSFCPDYSKLFQQIRWNGFDTSVLIASFWSVSYVYISTIFAIMTTQIISKVISAASFLIMTNYMRQLPRFMFWCLFPQCLHCQSFNAGLRASCWLPLTFSSVGTKGKIKFAPDWVSHSFLFCNICFTWKCVTKIPSEMVVALRFTLLTLFTPLTLFKLLYTA